MFYMKSDGGNAFRRVRSAEKRQELLRGGWLDVEAPVVVNEATEGKAEPDGKNEEKPTDAETPVVAKNAYQRRASGGTKGKTVTV